MDDHGLESKGALMLRRGIAVGGLLGTIWACKSADAPPPAVGGQSAVCATDADCARAAAPCGPCTSGAVVTGDDATRECVVNPCPNAVRVCSAEHRCVVK